MNFDSLVEVRSAANFIQEAVDFDDIRSRQQSCYAKDLSKEETPDFLKDVNTVTGTKQSITDIMYVSVEDESLLKYKLSLL